jgi:hypothetical protein
MSKLKSVVGRLVKSQSIEGIGRVRVGHDRDWDEYRVQAWDLAGALVAEYHTDDRQDALNTAARILSDLSAQAGMPA